MQVWKETWAFLFLDKDIDLAVDHTSMVYAGGIRMLIYGANTVGEATEIAKRIVSDEDCTLIELCGGFNEEGAKEIRRAVGADVHVGFSIPYAE